MVPRRDRRPLRGQSHGAPDATYDLGPTVFFTKEPSNAATEPHGKEPTVNLKSRVLLPLRMAAQSTERKQLRVGS